MTDTSCVKKITLECDDYMDYYKDYFMREVLHQDVLMGKDWNDFEKWLEDANFHIVPFNGKNHVVSGESKPIKIVFEGDPVDHFTREDFEKLVDKVKAAGGGNYQPNFIPTQSMVDSWTIDHPLSKAVNDGVDALVDAWKGFAKSFHSIYGKDTLEYKKDLEYWWKIACEDYLNNMEDNQLKITNYIYDKPVTKIKWSDGTTTKVSCNPDEADQFSGFLAAIAKKLFPDYLKEYEKYTVTIPKQEAEYRAKKAEEERIAAKRKEKRTAYKEKRRKIQAAKALAEQYQRELEEREIEKIAHERFGVPKSYFGDNDE